MVIGTWRAAGTFTVALSLLLPLPGRAAGSPRRLAVPVLVYHHVKWLKRSDNATERGLTILPSQFMAQLRYLRRNGYHTVSALQVVQALRGRRTLPRRPVVLTFDDGYRDVYAGVFRRLQALHMTATFFLAPGLLGGARYLTWAQAKSMARAGMDIEAHSMTHPDLTRVPPRQQRIEVQRSRAVLQSRLQRPVRIFAYPYGSTNRAVQRLVKTAGYWGAFTTRVSWAESSSNLFTLPRVYANHDTTVPVAPQLYHPTP